MKQPIILLGFLFCLIFQMPGAYAQDNLSHNKKYVNIEAFIERSSLQAGDTTFIALHKTLKDGWHTYWKNPGDSGEALKIKWHMPDDFTTGDLLFPVPHRIPYGPLTNYGYEKQATILQELKLPDPLPEGPIEITGEVDILVCEEICIPEYHEVSFTINPQDIDEAHAEKALDIVNNAINLMPVTLNWDAAYKEYQEDGITYFTIDLDFRMPALITTQAQGITFDILPYEWGIIDNNAITRIQLSADKETLTLFKKRGERPISNLDNLKILITHKAVDGRYGALEVTAKPDPVWKDTVLQNTHQDKNLTKTNDVNAAQESSSALSSENIITPQNNITVFGALFLALLGGLILNLMPCVFPVLSLKALSLCKMSGTNPKSARISGLAYTAGILASFAILAGILIILRQGGTEIGWGFHLQNPLIILALIYIFFIFGMNLSGFFEITSRFNNIGQKLSIKEGATGSFFTGVLAAIVATPCTAPFMGIAIGFALLQPAAIAMLIFLALGFGLALPYLLLAFFPALQKFLPKPGLWMQRFKELLAFALYASAAWLIWVLSQQSSDLSLLYTLLGIINIALLIWVFKVSKNRIIRIFIVVLTIFILGLAIQTTKNTNPVSGQAITTQNEFASHTGYSEETLAAALNTDKPVFINMTAAWCITCKVNERIALNTDSIQSLFAAKDVIYIKGDWTNRNAAIANYLTRYGRSGVPLYVYYGAPDIKTKQRPAPILLPQILTPGIIKDALS